MDRGVFVLGMHRSGTSAATRLASLLGVALCVEEDLLPAADDNPRGHWESRSLMVFNDRILDLLGCDWTCPPHPAPGWERGRRFAELRAEAPSLFSTIFPTEPWVWKDPRTCLTLSFWTLSLDVKPVVVLVTRNPLEAVESLRRRNRVSKLYALALWERYLRLCLAQAQGLPVLVTEFSEILDSPVEWCERLRGFLLDEGIVAGPVADEAVRGFIDHELRHFHSTGGELLTDPDVSGAQKDLWLALGELRGAHAVLPKPTLPPETASTEVLLAEQRGARLRAGRATELEDRMRMLFDRLAVADAQAGRVRHQLGVPVVPAT